MKKQSKLIKTIKNVGGRARAGAVGAWGRGWPWAGLWGQGPPCFWFYFDFYLIFWFIFDYFLIFIWFVRSISIIFWFFIWLCYEFDYLFDFSFDLFFGFLQNIQFTKWAWFAGLNSKIVFLPPGGVLGGHGAPQESAQSFIVTESRYSQQFYIKTSNFTRNSRI